ncbi:MAG: hypothetical protein ACREBF_01075, partial [Candidatus Micrarchaeales archaeon]
QIASKLNVSQRTVRRAAQLLEDAKKAELLDGRSRTGIAAAAIYIACVMEGETVTQRNVSNASKISEVTIRHHQQLFVKGLKLVILKASDSKRPRRRTAQRHGKSDSTFAVQNLDTALKTINAAGKSPTLLGALKNSVQDRKLIRGLHAVEALGKKLGLDEKYINQAHELYQSAYYGGTWNGKRAMRLTIAAIQATCTLNYITISEEEFLSRADLTKENLLAGLRTLKRQKLITPKGYLPRAVSALNLSKETEARASELIDKIEEAKIWKRADPLKIAAVAAYFALAEMGKRRTKRDVSTTMKIGQANFTRGARKINKQLKLNLDAHTKIEKIMALEYRATEIAKVLERLPDIKNALNLPDSILSRSKELLNMAAEKNVLGFMHSKTALACCIRLACIESKQQVESLKICKAISANESSISAATWKIDKGLGLNLRTAGKVYCKGDFTDPKAHVLKIGETLNLSSHVTSRAEELLVKVQEKKIFLRRSSRVIALTVLYFAAQGTEQKMTQKSLADAGKINPSSLHSALAELSEAFGIETRHKATQEERAQKIREASQRQKKKLKDSRVKELGNFALKLTDTLNLDSTSAEEAKRIWSMAKDKQVIQGRDEAGILCAAVYAACRLKDSFHSLREIVSRANELNGKSFDYGVIAGYYNTLIQELEIKMPPPDIATGVLQLAQRCDVSESTKNMALKILKRVGDEVVGANPYTLSGAILYGAARLSGNLKTQAEIARVTGVSEVSLRNNIKKLNV